MKVYLSTENHVRNTYEYIEFIKEYDIRKFIKGIYCYNFTTGQGYSKKISFLNEINDMDTYWINPLFISKLEFYFKREVNTFLWLILDLPNNEDFSRFYKILWSEPYFFNQIDSFTMNLNTIYLKFNYSYFEDKIRLLNELYNMSSLNLNYLYQNSNFSISPFSFLSNEYFLLGIMEMYLNDVPISNTDYFNYNIPILNELLTLKFSQKHSDIDFKEQAEKIYNNLKNNYLQIGTNPYFKNLILDSPIRYKEVYYDELLKFIKEIKYNSRNFPQIFSTPSKKTQLSYILNNKRRMNLGFIIEAFSDFDKLNIPYNREHLYFLFAKSNEIDSYLEFDLNYSFSSLEKFSFYYEQKETYFNDPNEIYTDINISWSGFQNTLVRVFYTLNKNIFFKPGDWIVVVSENNNYYKISEYPNTAQAKYFYKINSMFPLNNYI
ncbi:MAG: hypothetical protein SPJ84_03895 [Fusobacterium gastrosuis]|uniref:hypothetical protein n=1 Tax=Fusobacterium gastrosuis TaxID=1755100 RepID=UPI002A987FA5|nr:hypothetical protein [Fusobacteriaceae bacterium]MDY5794950.1 hypothetical protein [Fusobacterium gastrosuis]